MRVWCAGCKVVTMSWFAMGCWAGLKLDLGVRWRFGINIKSGCLPPIIINFFFPFRLNILSFFRFQSRDSLNCKCYLHLNQMTLCLFSMPVAFLIVFVFSYSLFQWWYENYKSTWVLKGKGNVASFWKLIQVFQQFWQALQFCSNKRIFAKGKSMYPRVPRHWPIWID